MFGGAQSIFVVISKPQVINTNYTNYHGFKCGKILQLGNITGYTTVDEIHLENIGNATRTELEMIENTCADKVCSKCRLAFVDPEE